MNEIYYKAVRLDKTSHWDKKTKWIKGRVITPDALDTSNDVCGHGIHCSPNILAAVSYQRGPSIYCEVEPGKIYGSDDTKIRCDRVRVIRWLERDELDALAGFKLWEANHPHHPLLNRPVLKDVKAEEMLKQWASVGASVGASVRDSVRASVGDSVGASVGDSVGDSVWDGVWDGVWVSVRDSVRASVGDSVMGSVWAYVGGLFPSITTWKHAEKLGDMPWQPLLNLWYAGYVPSFDGTTWRLHRGKSAKIVYEIKASDIRKDAEE